MGKTLEDKKAMVAELKQSLSESQLAIVIDYKGLSVAEITDLRKRLLPMGASCKIAKNTLMRIAVEGDSNWEPMTKFLKETSAFVLIKDDVGGALKAYQDFQKASKKTELRGGVMEGRALSQDDVKAIADLPSKEQLIAQIAGAINSVTAKVAIGINQVPSSVARAIQAIADKDKDQEAA
ncbi:MAG: 50S ribosomal protein L10 [Leptolyngbyaceae cyanobacterium bins.349]|nr:50S ribosomal protein L10 [Leptolyngbyaceae cyanobacterium bins.349]